MRRVLIVGEHPGLRDRVRRLLVPKGFAAAGGASGMEALRLVRDRDFDLMILAVGLAPPVGDRELLDAVQAELRTRALPVVAVGSGAQGGNLAAALARGAVEACPKVCARALLPAVERALAPNGAGAPSRSADVLHVEEDDRWAELARLWLERLVLKVHRVSTRGDLESYLLNCRLLPRCLLIEPNRPDGLALCDLIKASPAWQGLPIVALAGAGPSAVDCVRHDVRYRVAKGPGAADELCEALRMTLAEQARAQGVLDVGDLRLDPRENEVLHHGRLLAKLKKGAFAALLLLVTSSPRIVDDDRLYKAFLTREPYSKRDPELALKGTLSAYVSRLRKTVGREVGGRIVRAGRAGYAYQPPGRAQS